MRSIRFGIATLVFYPATWAAMLLGGWGLAVGPMVIFSVHLLLDSVFGPDLDNYAGAGGAVFDAFLYLHVPCAAVTYVLLMWQAAPGDLLGIGAALSGLAGPWVLTAHASYGAASLAACCYVAGLMLSTNTIVGHELVHRRSQPLALLTGRALLGVNGDAQFAISHVYGHHMQVATAADPATARRGESLYRFALRSCVGQYREAAALERARLGRLGGRWLSWRNQFLQALGMHVLMLVLSLGLAGAAGMVAWALAALVSKFLLENVNYIQHYGLLRMPGSKVEPRHSWDCCTKGATWVFYGLARHASHHARAALPYPQLMPQQQSSPQLDIGYIAAMFLAAVPPLWHRWATPRLLDWDRRLASGPERQLAATANLYSQYLPLMAASTSKLYRETP